MTIEDSAMTPTKATPAQIEAMRAIAAGRVKMVNRGYSAWRIDGATPQVVGRLVSLGWARWPKSGSTGELICELTDAGRTVLPVPVAE